MLVLLIGLSRLYLGVHFLTDVVAGHCAGALWTESVIFGQRFVTRRRGLRKAGRSLAVEREAVANIAA